MQAPDINPHRDSDSDQRLFLVGVDESHVDSHDAFLAARSFAREEDRITMQCVVEKVHVTDAKKDAIKKAFVNYAAREHHCTIVLAHHDSATIAQSFVKESIAEDATMLLIGAGTKLSGGALGSVADEILKTSKRHVCIVKPGRDLQPDKPKKVIYATTGNLTGENGLKELASLLNPAIDTLDVIVMSHHKGPKDDQALLNAQKTLEGSPLNVTFNYVRRVAGDSVGDTLLNYADSVDGTLITVATSRSTSQKLGSTSTFIATHGGTSVLILKVAGN